MLATSQVSGTMWGTEDLKGISAEVHPLRKVCKVVTVCSNPTVLAEPDMLWSKAENRAEGAGLTPGQ